MLFTILKQHLEVNYLNVTRICRGSYGLTSSVMCASFGVRLALRALHLIQHATVLSHVSFPPRDLGCTWSTVVAALAQYAHVRLSRRRTPDLVHACVDYRMGSLT